MLFHKTVEIFLRDRPTTATGIRMAGCDWTSTRPWWCTHALPHFPRGWCAGASSHLARTPLPPPACLCVRRRRARGETHTRPPPSSIRAHAFASVFVRQSWSADTVVDRVRIIFVISISIRAVVVFLHIYFMNFIKTFFLFGKKNCFCDVCLLNHRL